MSKLITQNYLSLTPSIYNGNHGDYKTAKDAVAAFKAGKDFMAHSLWGQGYISIREFAIGVTVNIRYKRMERIAVYTVKAEDHKPKPVAPVKPLDMTIGAVLEDKESSRE